MTPRRGLGVAGRAHAGATEGFVLVGVVMFVLALTILGLSLFSLSSYEGQFVQRSQDSDQALQTAMGGLEHAKLVLARKQRLEDVATTLYPDSVLSARAKRMDGSANPTEGPLDDIPANVPIELRVLASVNGERRMVQTQVLQGRAAQLYKRLMTITDSLHARPDAAGTWGWACDGYRFYGEIWEGGRGGSAWRGCASGWTLSSLPTSSIPVPDVTSFFAQRLSTAQDIQVPSPNTAQDFTIQLLGSEPPPRVNYFRTISNPGDGLSSLHIPLHSGWHNNRIQVRGWNVWMLPRGLRMDVHFRVEGLTGNDCLVIVAGKADDDDSPGYGRFGIEFSAALSSFSVPVILVTDRWVFLEHFDWPYDSDIEYLNVFAKGVSFWGPRWDYPDWRNLRVRHDANDPRDAPDGLIDQLCEQGALPNSDSGVIKFRPVAGTWQELDPDNPPN